MLKEKAQTHIINCIDLIKAAEKSVDKAWMPLRGVCAWRAGGCACVSTCAPPGTCLCPSPNRGVRDMTDRDISSSALKLLQREVPAWTMTCIHGLDPTCGNHSCLCMGRWTLRWAFVLWTSEPAGDTNHRTTLWLFVKRVIYFLEETTRHSEGLNSTAKNITPELDVIRKASRFRQMRVSKGSILFFSSQKVVF